jgi:hypothetical protein
MKARIEPLLRMACTYCGAPIGQPCQSKNGRKLYDIGQIHGARLSRRSAETRGSSHEPLA